VSDEHPNEPSSPSPHPSPWYPPPPYGYAPAPAVHGPARGFGLAIAAGIVALVLVIGVLSYAIGGYLIASNRIANAAAAINAVDSQRTTINSSFDTIQQVMSFDTPLTPSDAKAKTAEIVPRSQMLASTVAGDAPALHGTQLHLNDMSWLTAFSRGSLQDESGRLDHARKAVADVKNAAEDYRLLGGFLQSYYQVFIDLYTLSTASQTNDSSGFAIALLMLQSDLAISLELDTMPYLPDAYRVQLTAIQAEINDIKQGLLASDRGDQAGIDAASKALDADIQRVNTVDYAGTAAAVRSHFQQYRDIFNAEMDMATL